MKRNEYQTKCPDFLSDHIFEMKWSFSEAKAKAIWDLLQRRETFVSGQLFPFRVEFDHPVQTGLFEKGELNIHHGPLLSAHGVIGEISATYRSLEYFYGAYVLSFRWIRPTLLEFFRTNGEISMKLHAQVSPWIRPFYELGLKVFWKFFGITFLFNHIQDDGQ